MDLNTLAAIRNLLITLTWKKIIQVFVSVLIIIFSYILYQSRLLSYNYLIDKTSSSTTAPTVKLSSKTQEEIKQVVNGSSLIVGIHVTVVDFQKNTKSYVYYYINDQTALTLYHIYEQSFPTSSPLFSNDVESNKRLIQLLNGEFICTPFADTPLATAIPGANKYISTLCSNGIPPFFGKFTGVISLYTRQPPTPIEVDQIRAILTNLSATIYIRDFK